MRLILAAVAALLICGCATRYQPQGATGGFSETQIAPDAFRVAFKANGYTAPEDAEDMVLLRGAELTLQAGFSHFEIVDGNARSDMDAREGWGTVKPRAIKTIQCFHGKPENRRFVYDAAFMVQTLGAKFR